MFCSQILISLSHLGLVYWSFDLSAPPPLSLVNFGAAYGMSFTVTIDLQCWHLFKKAMIITQLTVKSRELWDWLCYQALSVAKHLSQHNFENNDISKKWNCSIALFFSQVCILLLLLVSLLPGVTVITSSKLNLEVSN